jgi:hypothetical protein
VQLSVLRPVPLSEPTGGIIGVATIIGAMVAAGFVPPAGDRIRSQLGIAVSIALRHSRRIRRRLISRPASIAAPTLAIAGVAYANRPRQLLVGYRELLALAIGVLWIITEWVGLEQRQAPRYVDLDTDTALGCCPDHHQHYADIQCSAAYADAGHESGAFDFIGPWHLSGGPQSSIASELFSRSGFSARSAGDLPASTFRAFLRFGSSISDRRDHDLLVGQGGGRSAGDK